VLGIVVPELRTIEGIGAKLANAPDHATEGRLTLKLFTQDRCNIKDIRPLG